MTDGRKTLDEYKLINLRDVVFVNPIQDENKCSKCQLLLQFPKQTSCGHRFCEECIIKEILRFILYNTMYSHILFYRMLGRSCKLLHSMQMYTCMHANARDCKYIHIHFCRKQTWFYISLYSGSRTCLVDGQDLTMTKINPDNHCIRELMALKCICPNRERGCPWTDVVELLRVIMIMRHIACTFYYHLYSWYKMQHSYR